MKLGSLFDGSGGFPLGAVLNGIEPVWASEIEPFPIRVTTRRFPNMKHYGNVAEIDGGKVEPVDIITFGSPCQDMSTAGKRAGLGGSRSNLFYEAVRIIKEMRKSTNGIYPRYAVWENVAGAFSSNKGEDFRCVLEAMCRISDEEVYVPSADKWQQAGCILGGHYSVAWRTFDAKYWGVPQRRKRIYLVADFAGECATKILFKPESVSWNTPKSFQSGQRAAAAAESGSGATGTVCLNDQSGNNQPFVVETPYTLKIRSGCEGGGKGALVQTDKSTTLSCNNDQTLFVPFGICSDGSNSMKSDNPHSGIYRAETARTLDGNGGNPSCNQGGIAVVSVQGSMIGRADKNGPQGSGINEDVSFTLNATDRHAVAFSQDSYTKYSENDKCGALRAAEGMYGGGSETLVYSTSKNSSHTDAEENIANTLVATDYKDPPTVNSPEYIVRRLTPTECARLQGFPDWWCDGLESENPSEEEISWWANAFETHRKVVGESTKPKTRNQIIKWLKNPHSDSAEYKMWGNGVALPCVDYVLRGIVESKKENKMSIPQITDDEKEILQSAIASYGERTQEDMLFEEMSELEKSILKLRRTKYTDESKRSDVIEELADVYIMVTQMYMRFCCTKEEKALFGVNLHKKIERLSQYIERDFQ